MSKLYVDEIHPKTSGGAVLIPNRPAFQVHSPTATGNNSVVYWQTDVVASPHFNKGNGKFSAPISGVYHFFWQLLSNENNAWVVSELRKNGSAILHNQQWNGSGEAAGRTTQGSALLSLSTSDYVECYSGASTYANINTGTNSFFGGYLIG